ncbi:hypothetical protein CBL_10567 [Carabus blaptoides fortunei]
MLQMQERRLTEASEVKNRKLQELQGKLDNSNTDLIEKIKKTGKNFRNSVMRRIASPKGYEHPRSNILRLPCRQTLNRYISTTGGVDTESLIKCRLISEAEAISPIERVCSLIIDDMAIKGKCYYSRPEDKYFGYDTTQESSILRMVTDNHKSNVAIFKLLGDGNLMTRISNPVMSEIPLFLSFDYCHAQKNVRNIFLDHDMESEEGTISADYVRALYNMQKDLIIKPVPFLTRKHVYPSNFEKMNVNKAVLIFSSPVTAALEYLGKYPTYTRFDFSNSSDTVTFMKMMNMFFKIHDVSNRLQHIRQLDETHAPFVYIGDERLEWLQNTFQDCSFTSKIGNIFRENNASIVNEVIHLPENVTEALRNINSQDNFFPGIISASVAFIAGHLVRTIEERISCEACLDCISSPKCLTPLLGLIYFQDRGGLRYPHRKFT